MLGHNQLDDKTRIPVGLSDSEINIKYGELWELIDSLEVAADSTSHIFRDTEFLFVDTKQINLRDADRFVQAFKP